MSIRFVCACGKHLRARNEMAARRTVCPACGAPVGIPSSEPTQRGTTADPLSLASRHTADDEPAIRISSVLKYGAVPLPDAPSGAPKDSDYRIVRLDEAGASQGADDQPQATRRRRRRRPWNLETHPSHFLAYPLRAWPLIAWLGAALTVSIGVLVVAIVDAPATAPSVKPPWFVAAFLPFLVVCYLCGLWNSVLTSAVAGEAGVVRWPGKDLRVVGRGVVRCFGCFLAGPVVLAAVAYWFWLDAGDLAIIDWLILGELSLIAAGYWLLALLVVAERNGLRHATPLNVLASIRRLRIRGLVGAVFFWLVIALHALWSFDILGELHTQSVGPWLSLWACCTSLLFWMTLLLRWLGVRSFMSRVGKSKATSAFTPGPESH
jgi:hypothetical protein